MLYNYKGTKIEASSKEEAIDKIIASTSDIVIVDTINAKNYKDYIGKKVNVRANVYLNDLNLKELPIIFNIVSGSFYCDDNYLVSLKNCPVKVGDNFSCSYNNLISLSECPKEVKGNFSCKNNNKKFTLNDVTNECNVSGKVIV